MRNDFYTGYLMHHGIKGQKWGVRNGPPYPIKQRKSNYGNSSIDANKYTHLSDAQKVISDNEKTTINPNHYKYNCKEVAFTTAQRLNNNLDVVANDVTMEGNLYDFVEYYTDKADGNVYSVSGDGKTLKKNLEKQITKRIESGEYHVGDVGAIGLDLDPNLIDFDENIPEEEQTTGHCFNFKIEDDKSITFFDQQGDTNGNLINPDIYLANPNPNKQAEYVDYANISEYTKDPSKIMSARRR